MKVNIAIAEDEEFRQHVRDMISGEIRKILREEMRGLITGELAKSRLLSPDSPALNDLIDKRIQALAANALIAELNKVPVMERFNPETRKRLMEVLDFIRNGPTK